MSSFHGLWAASVTPLTNDLLPDADRLVGHIDWLFTQGCDGVLLFGTTGEANSFSVSERRHLLDSLAARDVDLTRVIVGTGCSAQSDTIELTRHATDVGCPGVLMLPPFYYKSVSDDGLFGYMSQVIDHVDRDSLRVLLYHFPKMSGVGWSVHLTQRLKTTYPQIIAGIKDSSGDTDNLTLYCREIDDFDVFSGTEALLSYALEEGGVGCISATANLTSRLIRSVLDGEKGQADRMIRTLKALEAFPLIPMIKHMLAEESGEEAWRALRPPLMKLSAAHESRLQEILDTIGVLPNFVEPENDDAR